MRVAGVAELPPMRAQPGAQRTLVGREFGRRVLGLDTEALQRLTRPRLGDTPRRADDALEVLPQFA
ncbi:hypothetical protein LLG88_10900 [bacterium]|nr:hypothetical protein [bacterium]